MQSEHEARLSRIAPDNFRFLQTLIFDYPPSFDRLKMHAIDKAYSRRKFIRGTAAVIVWAAGQQKGALAQTKPLVAKSRLILLGTGGGPRPRKQRFASSQVLIVNGKAYVIDCGDGVAIQLARADVPLPCLRHVFITHHHSDHNADHGNLLLLAWGASSLKNRVDSWGPPPLNRVTQLFFEMNATDIQARESYEGLVPLLPLVHVHELRESGKVLEDENLKVTCALVDHPPMKHAFAYRFDAPDRSIVISGDTRRCNALVELARGADVLVHEALYLPAAVQSAALTSSEGRINDLITNHHTSAEDAGRVAESAGVKTLVLSHLIPADDPNVSDEMWITAARKTYNGRIIVAKDLIEI